MIKCALVFNHHGNPRLIKFYEYYPEEIQQKIVKQVFQIVSERSDEMCNFVEAGSLICGPDSKLMYKHYATLYFVFCADASESELGILDLIQIFVETLDACFETVCELDIIFHADKVHNILNEIIMGGLVLEIDMREIISRYREQRAIEKKLDGIAGAPIRAASAVKNKLKDEIRLGDLNVVPAIKARLNK